MTNLPLPWPLIGVTPSHALLDMAVQLLVAPVMVINNSCAGLAAAPPEEPLKARAVRLREMVTGNPTAVMMVESVVEAGTEPPPETVTEFTWGDVALAATLTLTAMPG